MKLTQRLNDTEAQRVLQLTYNWACHRSTSNSRMVRGIIDAMPEYETVQHLEQFNRAVRNTLQHILSLLIYWHGYEAQFVKSTLRKYVVSLSKVINAKV